MASFLDDQTDPWLTTRMRQLAARAEAENLIGEGVFTAIARFLAIARAAVLGESQERTQPQAVATRVTGAPTFQAGEEEEEQLPPPNLDAWPDEQIWLELLAAHVIPRIGQTWDIHYGMQTTFDDSRWKFAYLEEVSDRLKIWPRNAFEDIRFELLEGMQQGETIRELRARVGRSLAIDARSRTAQAEINDLTKVIDDPETGPTERKAARARRAELYRSMDIEDAEWQWKAARIARTEAMGAMNGGTYAGARVHEIATGERRWKQWWATSDNRVRDTHWVVHMKVKPLDEPFTVGGFDLMHPGQAGGPAHEVINCRCLMLVLTLEEAREEEIRYNQYRPGRRNIEGQEMDDNGQPITAPAISMAARRLLGWHTDDAHGRLIASGDWCSPDPHALERTIYAMTTEPIVLPATGAPEPDPATTGDKPLPVGWRGVLAPLNVPSADWRMLLLDNASDAQTRPLPLPFKFQDEQWGGHDGAFGVGLITKIWRDGELLWGSGPFDLADPRAAEIARKVRDGYQGWVSVDLDPPRVAEYRWWKDGAPIDGPDPDGMEVEAYPEWRLSSATLVMDQAFPEAKVYPVYDLAEIVQPEQLESQRREQMAARAATFTVIGDTGLPWAPREHAWDGDAAAQRVADWAGGTDGLDPARYSRAFLYRDADADPKLMGSYKLGFADLVDGQLRAVWNGVTAVYGALQGARSPVEVPESDVDGLRSKVDALYRSAAKAFDDETIVPPGNKEAALVAAGGPLAAPADWFMYPGFSGPTGWTVTDDGRVYGHAGLFEGAPGATPHIGWYMNGRRIFAPRETVYDRHNTKPYRVAEGYDIGVGLVVIDTNHADTNAWVTAGQAMDHYANTGSRIAFVRAGSDQWGTWVAGTLVPGLTPEQIVHIRALALSGDWREVDGKVQFICGLGVNVEALHVPRQVIGEDGRVKALVAACPVLPSPAARQPVPIPASTTRYVVADPAEFARAVVAEQSAARQREADAAALYMRIVGPEIDRLAARIRKGKR